MTCECLWSRFSPYLLNVFYRYKNFAPKLNGRYLTSNVNITIEKSGQLKSVPLGSKIYVFPVSRDLISQFTRPVCEIRDTIVSFHGCHILKKKPRLFWNQSGVSGRKVTAFGVLFHFQLNSVNTTVQPPSKMVQESWVRLLWHCVVS